ncbi:hypothetical protein [Enterococcus sp. DIV1314a]|uniref:hypothetical protein n=1 Tax=Enterococcus sp. DIV1314a TaxID=2774660 RepID=UPI003F1FB6EB
MKKVLLNKVLLLFRDMSQKLNACQHEYEIIAHIGGDAQANALKCKVCGKQKVECDGILGYIPFDEIVKRGSK